jgi:phage-related protein
MALTIRFYATARGTSHIRDFLRSLPPKHRMKCTSYLKRIREHGTNLPSNIVKHLESGLWEARPEYGGIEYRFLFFIIGSDQMVIVSAVTKKRDKLERGVIETALRRMQDWRSTGQGTQE